MYNWESLQSFFSTLNNNAEYLVLRNYEVFFEGKLFNDKHPDIDILCHAPQQIIPYAKSVGRTKDKNDFTHQQVMINDKVVDLDIRFVGDGYYDKLWEIDMLKQRKKHLDFCYVMDDENYFYSLLYHALIQKNSISMDYQKRLEYMASKLPVEFNDSPISIESLQTFMRSKSYMYTYPLNPGTIANFSMVDKSLIKKDIIRIFNRFMYKMYCNIR